MTGQVSVFFLKAKAICKKYGLAVEDLTKLCDINMSLFLLGV